MLVNVFDITNALLFKRCELEDDKEFLLKKSLQMSNVLFVPPNDDNRAVYAQDFDRPCIEDIFDGERLNFERARTLDKILDNLKCGEFKECDILLNDFFKLQLNEEDLQDEIKNIILVHDDFGPETQEHLLSAFPKERDRTTLLWRSIAACIGAENELKQFGAKELDRVLIIDAQNKNALLSIFKLKNFKRNNVSMLVPQRKLFRENSPNYGKLPFVASQPSLNNLPDDIGMFYTLVFSRTPNIREFVAPHDCAWKLFPVPQKTTRRLEIPPSYFAANNIRHCIIVGDIDASIPHNINTIRDRGGNLLFAGACKFAFRKENKLPTYLDHCESLSIVVQRDEKIETETLIDETEDALGGEELLGKINEKCFIRKQDSRATFYLIIGKNDKQLKELIHDFGKESEENQKLILEPKMQPGQGIARVFVDASPLIYGRIELNFREMKPSAKTLEILQKEIKRSFPIDMPQVKADFRLWQRVEDYVNSYLDGYPIQSSVFAKASYINPKAKGIERFERKNVFGLSPKTPPSADVGKIEKLFHKICEDYKQAEDEERGDFVKLAAWTYAGDSHETFARMTTDILERVEYSAKYSTPLAKQYFTYCSNFLTQKENIDRFYNAFCLRIEKEFSQNRPKFGSWIYGISNIITFNNNFFEIFGGKEVKYPCEFCMNLLFNILKYSLTNSGPRIFTSSICAMLFLLKYRKYNPDFLRSGKLYNDILEYVDEQINLTKEECSLSALEKEFKFNCKKASWLESFRNYLTGNGTIDGIPTIDDEQ